MRRTEQFLTPLMPGTRLLYGLALGGYLGTLALLTAWYAWLAPSIHFPIAYALLFLLTPLLFALRGMLHGRLYTFQWSCFLALFYFIHGVGEAYASDTARHLGLLEILFTSTWFLAAMAYIRRSKQH
jgi:uncharacterized membrane protein